MTLIKCRDTNLNAPSGCKNSNLACLFNVYTYAKRLQSWNDIITHQTLIINEDNL
jgi:Fe-S cluster biosynthesis and repair protein YggX